MRWKIVELPGSFGDKLTLTHIGLINNPKGAVLILHGVHSCASPEAGNKYALLSQMLSEQGLIPIITETSRKIRNRLLYKDDLLGWIQKSFGGKTFEDEIYDSMQALTMTKSLYSNLPISLWGFSLGGLIALILAGGALKGPSPLPNLEGLIISGSGDCISEQSIAALKLPILSTVSPSEEFHRACQKVNSKWCHFFYGSEDTTFDLIACQRLFDLIKVKKAFHIIQDSDHSFRTLNGAPSKEPLREMVDKLLPFFS